MRLTPMAASKETRNMKRPGVCALGIAAIAVVAACSGGGTNDSGSDGPTGPPTTTVASVEVTPASAALSPGQTVQLSAVAKNASGGTITGQTFSWTSSNSGVATVSSSGLVRAVAAGSATVSASTGGKTGTATITVSQPAIRIGLWQGTLPSAPAGSGTLSFRVTSATSMTFLSTRVPTFTVMSGCSSTWNNQVTIGSNRAFTATLTSGNTSLSIEGTFDTDSEATGTIVGTCNGSLVLLGQTFRANWVSN